MRPFGGGGVAGWDILAGTEIKSICGARGEGKVNKMEILWRISQTHPVPVQLLHHLLGVMLKNVFLSTEFVLFQINFL